MNNNTLRLFRLAPYFLGILGLTVAVFTQSRAFAFAFFFAIFIVYTFSEKRPLRVVILGFVFLITALLLITFYVKTDSSLGRLLIYKISFEIFKDNWLFGIGLAEFKQVYLFRQARYFANGNYSPKELLLADNTYYAFNDYWQFVLEMGISGLVIIMALFYILGKQIRNAIQHNNHKILKININIVLIAILTAAFFTHVFENSIFQFTTILCVAVLCVLNYSRNWMISILLSLSIVALLFIGVTFLRNHMIDENYKNASRLFIAGLKSEAKSEIQKIYPINDNKRAVLYLQILLASFNLKNEKEIISLIVKYPNANSYKLLGDFYTINNKFKAAEEAYLMAINMVPNRFLPRQNLLQLYISQKKFANAQHVAENIISLAVKVDSYQVQKIKLEAIKFSHHLNQN